MILAVLLILTAGGCQDAPLADLEYDVLLPEMFIQGEAFTATITVHANAPAAVPVWAFSAAAFELSGEPLVTRTAEAFLPMVPGQELVTSFDLSAALAAAPGFVPRGLSLRFTPDASGQDLPILVLQAAEKGIDFMTLPKEQLGDYDVVLMSLHGPIWVELWPDVAPMHARNFLDLAYTGFYDETDFHRVVPGFMIQGGGAKPTRPAPRRLKNEFNARRHLPGVLSMARFGVDTKDEAGQTIPAFDSATSEFFVMHAVYPSLDGKYTGFGQVVTGMDAVEAVVQSVKGSYSPRDPRTHRPKQRQFVERAVVVKAPKERPSEPNK